MRRICKNEQNIMTTATLTLSILISFWVISCESVKFEKNIGHRVTGCSPSVSRSRSRIDCCSQCSQKEAERSGSCVYASYNKQHMTCELCDDSGTLFVDEGWDSWKLSRNVEIWSLVQDKSTVSTCTTSQSFSDSANIISSQSSDVFTDSTSANSTTLGENTEWNVPEPQSENSDSFSKVVGSSPTAMASSENATNDGSSTEWSPSTSDGTNGPSNAAESTFTPGLLSLTGELSPTSSDANTPPSTTGPTQTTSDSLPTGIKANSPSPTTSPTQSSIEWWPTNSDTAISSTQTTNSDTNSPPSGTSPTERSQWNPTSSDDNTQSPAVRPTQSLIQWWPTSSDVGTPSATINATQTTDLNGTTDTTFADCSEWYNNGNQISDVYTISPLPGIAVSTYCDMETGGGGWTVIQKRYDGSQNFSLLWENYKQGFGSPSGDYWLGNDIIHSIVNRSSVYELRVELTDTENSTIVAEFESFEISDESDFYKLNVTGYMSSSEAGDGGLVGQPLYFSTVDADHDRDNQSSCANERHGGWWYGLCNETDLNGGGLHGGAVWSSEEAFFVKTSMKIRRKYF